METRGKNNQEFNSFEDNNQQIILVRNNSSSPIVRPGLVNRFSSKLRVNCPAGVNSLNLIRSNPVRSFSIPRRFITGQPVIGAHRQRTRLDGVGNPGGGASSDDQCPVPKVK